MNTVAQGYGRGLKLLMAAAGFVLLIVCANVANLLLVRATAERQQQAVRIALGATRGQLVRQAMISSVLLALAGGAGAIAIAYGVAHSVLRLAFRGSDYVPVNVNPSLPVLGFAVLAALVTAILCAVIPAWISTKTDPASAIRGTSRTMKDSSSAPQRVLVVTQAALSVVLLVRGRSAAAQPEQPANAGLRLPDEGPLHRRHRSLPRRIQTGADRRSLSQAARTADADSRHHRRLALPSTRP